MGSERKWRSSHCPLVRNHPSRALGRIYRSARPDGDGHFRQCHHELLVVWSQHVGHWTSFLRFHAKNISVAGGIYVKPARVDGDRSHTTQVLAQFSNISSSYFYSQTRRIWIYASKTGS